MQILCTLLFSETPTTSPQSVSVPVPRLPTTPTAGSAPTVMDIDGVKYIYVMKPTGESELIPVPVLKLPPKIVETQVEIYTPPLDETNPPPVTVPVTPTVSIAVTVSSSPIYLTPQTSVTTANSVSPPVESKTTDGNVVTHQTFSLMKLEKLEKWVVMQTL